MPITSIQRDSNSNVCFVRIISTDNLADISQDNYIADNQDTINSLNGGTFGWFSSDMLLIAANDGNALFQFTNDTFSTLNMYGDQGNGMIMAGLKNQLAYYSGNGSVLSKLETDESGVLITDKNGKPSISKVIPSDTQRNITQVGILSVGKYEADKIEIPFGGTGCDSFTPYAVICGGDNSLQSVEVIGDDGDVFTSNGPDKLPSFKKLNSSGIVNPGDLNSIPFYSGEQNGKTLSPLPGIPNTVLVINGFGVPSCSNNLPDNLEIPGYVKISELKNLVEQIIKEL